MVTVFGQMEAHLWTHQIEHASKLERKLLTYGRALDGSDTGLGKTPVACAIAARNKWKMIIVSPKPVISDWFICAKMFGADVLCVTNYELAKLGRCYYELSDALAEKAKPSKWWTMSPHRWTVDAGTLIVFDEAHKGKNCQTQNSSFMRSCVGVLKRIGGAGRTAHSVNIGRVDSEDANARLLILSATIADTPQYFAATAILLGLCAEGQYPKWLSVVTSKCGGNNQCAAIHRAIYPKYASRMTIEDAASSNTIGTHDFRAEVYTVDPAVELELETQYADIRNAIASANSCGQNACILERLLYARMRIEAIKVNVIVDQAIYWIGLGKSISIAVNFNKTMDMIINKMNAAGYTNVSVIRGGQGISERAENINAFRTRKNNIVVLNIKSGGTGISLHGNDIVGLICPTWSSMELIQTVGRLYRVGCGHTIQRVIYCVGAVRDDVNAGDTTFSRVPIEKLMADKLNQKLSNMSWINDGIDEDNFLMDIQ